MNNAHSSLAPLILDSVTQENKQLFTVSLLCFCFSTGFLL